MVEFLSPNRYSRHEVEGSRTCKVHALMVYSHQLKSNNGSVIGMRVCMRFRWLASLAPRPGKQTQFHQVRQPISSLSHSAPCSSLRVICGLRNVEIDNFVLLTAIGMKFDIQRRSLSLKLWKSVDEHSVLSCSQVYIPCTLTHFFTPMQRAEEVVPLL